MAYQIPTPGTWVMWTPPTGGVARRVWHVGPYKEEDGALREAVIREDKHLYVVLEHSLTAIPKTNGG